MLNIVNFILFLLDLVSGRLASIHVKEVNGEKTKEKKNSKRIK